jgi:hypothetical protein
MMIDNLRNVYIRYEAYRGLSEEYRRGHLSVPSAVGDCFYRNYQRYKAEYTRLDDMLFENTGKRYSPEPELKDIIKEVRLGELMNNRHRNR